MIVTFFFSGIACITFSLAGLLFLKFWKASGDKFFKQLGIAFWMLGMERVVGLVTHSLNLNDLSHVPTRTWLYLIRLIAFIVILFALIQKNRSEDLR